MEAPSGFEPENNGFADRPLGHLGTAPPRADYRALEDAVNARKTRTRPADDAGGPRFVSSSCRVTDVSRYRVDFN